MYSANDLVVCLCDLMDTSRIGISMDFDGLHGGCDVEQRNLEVRMSLEF